MLLRDVLSETSNLKRNVCVFSEYQLVCRKSIQRSYFMHTVFTCPSCEGRCYFTPSNLKGVGNDREFQTTFVCPACGTLLNITGNKNLQIEIEQVGLACPSCGQNTAPDEFCPTCGRCVDCCICEQDEL